MEGLNQCTFTGNVTRDATVRKVNDKDVASFGIAVNGRQNQDVLWVDCSYWRPNGVIEYIKKGKPILVSGNVQLNTYDSKSGEVKAVLRLNVQKLLLLGSGGGNSSNAVPVGAQGKEDDWGGF
jgi:single-strand DNA-binding protein